jgi:hypothetical protein
MHGQELRVILDAHPHATPHKQDNNEYLVSYRFDTGAEVAFDPRTVTKCSVFVSRFPERMKDRLGKVTHYPPENPSTALARVSPQLASDPRLFKVDLPSIDAAHDLLAWVRWA